MREKVDYFKPIFLCVFISFVFFIPGLKAQEMLPPRISAAAYTGVYTVGLADLMLSLDGDAQHNLYVNPQGAYGSDQQWYGDLGLGYRWIKNDAAIVGWYLFAGHTRVANNSNFWITNPGVEVMGSRWDARINAYIPVAGRSNELGTEEFNIVSSPVFTGHTEVVNTAFNNENAIQQIGNGADARVGYQLFRYVPLKAYVGGYFFAIPNTDNVRGGAAGLEYWFDDNIRVFANYSYDNSQHSNVVGGLGISFGGVRKHWADPTLSERLMDPVDRYLANLGHGSGIPSKTLLYGMGRGSSTELISTDIAFFSQTGTPNTGGNLTIANCTFENPCGPNDFTQAGVNSLNPALPNTMFYFNGGTYPASNVGGALTLNTGQSIFSRTADYSAPATGAARSTFNGGFVLNGSNELSGVILNNTLGASTNGISTNGGQNITISNSQIGSTGAPYNSGVLANGGSITIQNTSVFGVIFGIGAQNAALTVESSQINAQDTGTVGISIVNSNAVINSTQINAQGIDAIGLGAISSDEDINNSQINVLGASGSSSIVGLNATQNSVVQLQNSGVTVQYINSPPNTSIGLKTIINAQIEMLGGNLTVSGNNTSALMSGSDITLGLVSCTLNGVTAAC